MKATQKLCTAALTSAFPLLMESRLPSLTGQLQNAHPSLHPVDIGNLKFDETPQQIILTMLPLGAPSCHICHSDTQVVVQLGRTRHCKWSLAKLVPWCSLQIIHSFYIFLRFWDQYLLHIGLDGNYTPPKTISMQCTPHMPTRKCRQKSDSPWL